MNKSVIAAFRLPGFEPNYAQGFWYHMITGLQSSVSAEDNFRVRSTPRSILFVGRDGELLRQGERVIAGRSDLSVRCLTPEQAEAAARTPVPHLWIFCCTVELPKLAYLACSVRRCSPESRLLLLKNSHTCGFEDSLFHCILPASQGTEAFLDAVSSLAVAE